MVLGILAGIVVFAVSNLTEDATKSSCATDQHVYVGAVEAYRVHNGAYPIQDADIVGTYVKTASEYWTVTANMPDRVQAKITLPTGCVDDPQS